MPTSQNFIDFLSFRQLLSDEMARPIVLDREGKYIEIERKKIGIMPSC